MDFKFKHNLIEEKHWKVSIEVSNVLLHLIFVEVWKQQGPKVPLMQKILHQGVYIKSETHMEWFYFFLDFLRLILYCIATKFTN